MPILQWPPFSLCPSFRSLTSLFPHHLLPSPGQSFYPHLCLTPSSVSLLLCDHLDPWWGQTLPWDSPETWGHAWLIHHFPPTAPLYLSPLLHSCTFLSLFIHALSASSPLHGAFLSSFPDFLVLIYHSGSLAPQYRYKDIKHAPHARNPNLTTHKLDTREFIFYKKNNFNKNFDKDLLHLAIDQFELTNALCS